MDSDLTPKGVLQARKVSSFLHDGLNDAEEITAIYSSPLGRAVETCNTSLSTCNTGFLPVIRVLGKCVFFLFYAVLEPQTL